VPRTHFPCLYCGGAVYILFQTCPHCGRPTRFNPPIEAGTPEARRVELWRRDPDSAPPEFWYPPRHRNGQGVAPESTAEPKPSDKPAVVLGPSHRAVTLVRGEPKEMIRETQYDVVAALLKAGERGLTGKELEDASGHGDAVKTLRRLARSDVDWRAVIHFPGRGGRRYWIGSGPTPKRP
jgi:hypothetical protein